VTIAGRAPVQDILDRLGNLLDLPLRQAGARRQAESAPGKTLGNWKAQLLE
jgi:hypothetical protein